MKNKLRKDKHKTMTEQVYEKLEDLIGLRGGTPFGGSYGDNFDSFAKKNLNLKQLYFQEPL